MDRRAPLRIRRVEGGPSPKIRRRTARTLSGGYWAWLAVLPAGALGLLAGSLMAPDPARPELSTQEVQFGTVRPGETTVRQLTLRNAGEAQIRIAPATLDSNTASLRLDDGCSNRVLKGGESCPLGLVFEPVSDGELVATLKVQPAGSEEDLKVLQPVRISGRAASSHLAASPETADYGTVMVGDYGPRHAVELTNAGSAPLRVQSVGLGGLGAADFLQASGDCAGAELEPQSTCRVEFDFVPTAEGERRADIVVESDADRMGALPELLGVGVQPRPGLSVSVSSLDFGSIRAGSEQRSERLYLLNDGNAALRLVDIGLSRGDAGFRLDASDCARGTITSAELLPGASCELEITFRPRAEGESTSVVEIEHDAGDGAKRVPLKGRGTLPRLEVSESPLFVGRVQVGRVGEWHALELRNSGSADLKIDSIWLDGPGERSFDADIDRCLGVLAPGARCTARFRMSPRRKGPQRVEAIVHHDGPGERLTVTVNGLGI